MITFWTPRDGRFGIQIYLDDRGKALQGTIEVRDYESIQPRMTLPGGVHIFSAVDQLTPSQREAVTAIHDRLRESLPPGHLINDPAQVHLRYELSSILWREGINTFRVFRATDAGQVTRFPVFLREESRHTGNKSELLHDGASLRRALLSLRLRGYRLRDLLIVEFCDTADANGAYRKFSAFRVGDAIVPAHMMAGSNWMMKSAESHPTIELAREEAAYVRANPHEALLRRVFDLANIRFGRIDYGVLNGVPQVWEINMNPTMGHNPRKGKVRKVLAPEVQAIKDEVRSAYHGRLRPAFETLAHRAAASMRPIDVTVEPMLIERAHRELASSRRRRRLRNMARGLYEHPGAGALRSVVRLVSNAPPCW